MENEYLQKKVDENEHLQEECSELREKLAEITARIEEEANVLIPETSQKVAATEDTTKRVTANRLLRLTVEFDIPGVKTFKVLAILDTGATTCCIDQSVIPQDALEPNPFLVHFKGVNSETTADKKLKGGRMVIGDQQFRIPYTYAFPMKIGEDIQMLIGCNFIRAMHGGVRIEGDEVTFYKNVTTIHANITSSCIEDEEYGMAQEIERMSAHEIQIPAPFKRQFEGLIKQLQAAGYIGDNPIKHWLANKVTCQLDIKNPDITIEDRPLKRVTPQMQESFQRHIKALLDLKVIRPCQSKHRTTAFLASSGTTINPVTGKEERGKERMVFNYKRLNDNTHKDQYSLPGINTIINKIGNCSVYSKFDLKSGFHQVAMHPNSIPWTAFLVPNGLYEWLVMPFGLKNAPAVFQRRMDYCFKGTENFIAVYIDDILVFSKNNQEHAEHLKIMLKICKDNGLVLSPTKMKIGVSTIDFLGATIGNNKIQLQEHIIEKISEFQEDSLSETKNLRSWLGLLNYAWNYIPNMGKNPWPTLC
ncbi:uncharacterized protein LOC110095647 isoform X1 [Dendrobium catenatum]|uniref:RNA-directed DNA polymerase n=1 Tax=Dendrobium catenatum TaxID=906689 RepID=A0A2I0VER9_9ASPA|nr:uncharacterized protein LOC110095647 isoform X1 [Dendrobium catenatum]XP_028547706.1 uncharacterized protein LOC110095647 isoform X1 [Dendrobium catenatum]XP_028547707.1 uncharacterized protein LOC110095647 isoform X1 [Dendrobium catenatum]XP_028547708.1 uncharacterized protein LOC110095647 isoform X1 [Dendrobium catenatum]XP_028547709.1 uncharacterized protein LOC110095647 isoform X1 [Dendrobium catenatum]XP_028547710.1 uncharacterized protein LOC110095647 isoform X1 [Dendrobium catenatum]